MADLYRTDLRAERQRKRLIALMAADIAGGIIANQYGPGSSTEAVHEQVAERAVDVAERILRKVGL